MFENAKVRWSLILFILVLAVFWLTPNFMDTKTKSFLPKTKIVKGLDIQGGIHLVLGVDIEAYMRDKMLRLAKTFKEDLAKESIPYSDITITMDPRPAFIIKSASAADIQKAKDYISKTFPGTFQAVDNTATEAQFSYFENTERELKSQVVKQAIEVIRNRIDSYGTLEPNIAAQGEDRILVQLPGIEDSQKAKELINTTAKLEFMIVDDSYDAAKLQTMVDEAEKKGNYTLGKTEANGLEYSAYVKRINEDLVSSLPANREIVFQKPDAVESMTQSRLPLLVKNDEIVTGGMVEEAFVSKDPQSGRPEVSFQMSVDGRKPFGELTGKNVKGRMAIVLDKVMKTAPVLQSKITDSGRITLGSNNYQQMFDEAEFISRTLRAGALPASLQQLEERTVGPTLGSDSVKKGEFAGVVGCVLVFIFMIVYYGMLGMVANIALGMNVLLILAILSTLGATLTLPGIAGIVLTVGMAVDANVIIFERIKDELRLGKGIQLAIKNGFDSALSAIIDSNLTTAITCVMLIQFGTGAIRGFAVTLIIGVITSVFTAVFVSKTFANLLTQKFKLKKVIRF
jgi:preprotein translocase subunit SecD